ncbi:FtsX-like permease family protein [Lysinibacillus sp. NPDC096418]|uniref:FtsX-like permease family protein n=1 Tax=Lysinibacillus sp. NPDC096418 TaxID=3364138 RepID=UPI003805945A
MKIKKQYQNLSLVIVVACAVFICTLLVMYLSTTYSIKETLDRQNQQDFSLTLKEEATNYQSKLETAKADISERIVDFSNKYSFKYNSVNYKVIYDGNYIYRVMNTKRSIDVPIYSEGVAPIKKSEIAIDSNFSRKNNFSVGDTITFNNKVHHISGVFTLPDAVSPNVTDNSINYTPETQAIVLCSEEGYATWNETEKTSYSGRFLDSLSEEQKKIILNKMLANPDIQFLVHKEDNPQVLSTLIAKEKMFKICLISAINILGLTSMVLLIIIIIQSVAETKSDMGVLKALGYSTVHIAKPYFRYGFIVFAGAVFGYVVAYFISPLFTKKINATLLLPNVPQYFDIVQFVIFTITPALFFSVLAFGVAFFTLRKPPLEMIHGAGSVKINRFVKWVGRRSTTSPFNKTTFRMIALNNLILVFFALLTGFMASANLQIAFSLQAMPDKVSSLSLKGAEYESNVRFIEAKEDIISDSETPYYTKDCKLEFPNGSILNNGQFIALSNSLSVFKLYSIQKQKEIDISNESGIVVNEWMRKKYDLSIGDSVKVYVNDNIYILPVTAIEQSVYGEAVYSNIDLALNIGILENEVYNGVFTKANVEFDNKQHIFVSKMEDIESASSQKKETYLALSFLFIIIGLTLSVVTISIVVKIIISSNRKYLAMMKAFGYTNEECSKIVLSGFRIIAYIGFVIGTVYSMILTKYLFDMLTKQSTIAMPMTPDIKVIVLSFVIFAVSYEAIMLLYKKSMNAISLQEVMMK